MNRGQPRLFDDMQLAELKTEYAELRKTHSKNKSCEILAKKYYCSVSAIWTYMEVKMYG